MVYRLNHIEGYFEDKDLALQVADLLNQGREEEYSITESDTTPSGVYDFYHTDGDIMVFKGAFRDIELADHITELLNEVDESEWTYICLPPVEVSDNG